MNAPILLGFTRGVAPSKWAARWSQAAPGHPLELVPFARPFGRPADAEQDMLIERAAPGERPLGSDPADEQRSHHALRLYEEAVALVLPADHELAELTEIPLADLALVRLLDHPHHAPAWPAAEPWDDPSWMPRGLPAALELVATGIGGVLAPLPLARHLVGKREHAVLRVVPGDEPLPGTTIWASWRVERDAADLQQLAGILRGRTARSSRPSAASAEGSTGPGAGSGADATKAAKAANAAKAPAKKKPALKPNSRGAQLAAAREKAEREKAARRRAKKRR